MAFGYQGARGGKYNGFSRFRDVEGKKGRYLRAKVRVGRMWYRVSYWDSQGAISWLTRAGKFYFPLSFRDSKHGGSQWARVQAGSMRVSVIVKKLEGDGLGCRLVVVSRGSFGRRPFSRARYGGGYGGGYAGQRSRWGN